MSRVSTRRYERKWILRVVLGLVLVFAAVCVALAFSLGAIVKKGVETIGPNATRVDVKLKGAEVWLFAGRVQLAGFVLGNPPGCKTPSAITVDKASVSFRPGSVFSHKLVVESINLKGPVITLEGGLTENNLTQIEKNLNDYVGSSSTAPDSSAPSSSPAKAEKKLQVNELVITGAKLQVNTKLLGSRTSFSLSIPDIHLSGLGTGPDGITPVEVAQRALQAALTAATMEAAKNAGGLGQGVLNETKDSGEKAADKLKGLFH